MNPRDAEQRKIEMLVAAERLATSSSMEWRGFLEALEAVSETYKQVLLECENTNKIHHWQGYALALDALHNELSNPRELIAEAKRRLERSQKRTPL